VAKITECVVDRIQESLALNENLVEGPRKDIESKDIKIAAAKANTSTRTDKLEQYQRRNSLRIFGVKEETNESTNQIAIDVARQIGVVVSPSDIDRFHRIGKSGGKKHRPIIVKFVSYDKRNEVFKAKKILRKTGIVIQEDLTKIRADTVFSKKLLI